MLSNMKLQKFNFIDPQKTYKLTPIKRRKLIKLSIHDLIYLSFY